MTCRFRTTGLSLEEQIHAELVIVQRSSSVYLTEAAELGNYGAEFGIV